MKQFLLILVLLLSFQIIFDISDASDVCESTGTAIICNIPLQKTKVSKKPSYSLKQVKKHNSVNSCRSIIDSKIYNLTAWISKHPGGAAAIKSICGKDGSKAFEEQHGNSSAAKKQLESMLMGSLKKS